MGTRWPIVALLALGVGCSASPEATPSVGADVDAGTPADAAAPADGGAPAEADAPVCGEIASTSGTRLARRVLVADDGQEIPHGVVDGDRGSRCRAARSPGGVARCVPGDGNFLGWRCDAPDDPASVAFTEELVPIGGGIAARIHVGADGSRLFFLAFEDLAHRTPVAIAGVGYDAFGIHPAGDARLLPPVADALPSYWSERPPACASSSPRRDLLGVDGCTLTNATTHVTVGGRTFVTKPETAGAFDCACGQGGCVVTTSTLPVLRETDEIPLDAWAPARPVLAGTGRYRHDAWQIGCAVAADPGPWIYDHALEDVPCSPLVAEDGVTRCLPSAIPSPTAVVGFADDQCADRVAVAYAEKPAPRFALEGGPSNGFPAAEPPVRVFEVLAGGVSGARFFWRSGSQCLEFSDPRGWATYPIGPAVPPTTFGALRVELR